MSWLNRLIKIAQSVPITINSLKNLIIASSQYRDVPGQEYLLQGPEPTELQRLRNLDVTKLQQILKMFQNIFYIYGEEMKNEYDYDREPDPYEVEEEIKSYAEMYVAEYEFKDFDDIMSFVRHLERIDIIDVVTNSFGDVALFVKWLPIWQEWEKNVTQDNKLEMDITTEDLVRSHTKAYEAFNEGNEAYERASFEPFLDDLATFTGEILQTVAEQNENVGHFTHRNNRYERIEYVTEQEIPPWIDEDRLAEHLKERDELLDWYIDQHSSGYGGLEQSVREDISERDADYFDEYSRQLEHGYGFNAIESLAAEYDEEDEEDTRNDINLSDLAGISDDIGNKGWIVKGGVESAELASVLVYSILQIIQSDENLSIIFGEYINSLSIDTHIIALGIERFGTENIEVYGPLAERIEEIRVANAEERQRLREEEQKRLKELKRQEELRHQMLPTERSQLSPEQLHRMRELGIAKKPFGHETELSRGHFPGAGWQKMPKGMVPFRIAISPSSELLKERKIPKRLLEETMLHSVPGTGGAPSLGWVGGYADYYEKSLYINEVQSDLMQRTVHMRDPAKLRKQKQQELARIKSEIGRLENSIANAKSPRQQISEKIERIRLENEQLEPQGKQFLQNQSLIDRLLSQWQQAPEAIDVSSLQHRLQLMQNNLQRTQQEMGASTKEIDETRFHKDLAKYHDYKSRIENTFKDWVRIFFNSAMKLATDKGYENVYIITSEELMRMWAQYARPETQSLFERIYDRTAEFYGGTPIDKHNKKWFEIPVAQLAGKVAFVRNNWLHKLTKVAAHPWLSINPVNGLSIWQIHLNTFFNKLKESTPELASPEFEASDELTQYQKNETNREIFNMWVNEVPQELKMGEDLEPGFKNAVRNYMISNYGFDPYEDEENGEIPIPSVEELASWWA